MDKKMMKLNDDDLENVSGENIRISSDFLKSVYGLVIILY